MHVKILLNLSHLQPCLCSAKDHRLTVEQWQKSRLMLTFFIQCASQFQILQGVMGWEGAGELTGFTSLTLQQDYQLLSLWEENYLRRVQNQLLICVLHHMQLITGLTTIHIHTYGSNRSEARAFLLWGDDVNCNAFTVQEPQPGKTASTYLTDNASVTQA